MANISGVPGTPALDRAVRLASRRLLPMLLLMYVLSFLDRTNLAFARQAFQAETGISNAAYAMGASLFFLTYALFEAPSNLILHKVGARRWMVRIMVTWGLLSAAMMFATGERSFYALRLALGAAEAGFFPGVILYLTYWFPAEARGRVMGLFYFGAPLSFILGGPFSGWLLELHGLGGLQGWQWMFLVEGLLASLVGVWTFFYLDDRPSDARWLPEEERQALSAAVEADEQGRVAHGASRLRDLITRPRILLFVAIYFLIQLSVFGVIFDLPLQIGALLGKKVGLEVGLVTATPWLCAMAAVFFLPRLAGRYGGTATIAAIALALSSLGMAVSVASGPGVALIALCVATAGFIGAQPLFWTFPTRYLGGLAAAGGLAMINALGALGGFVAPNLKTWADARFGSPNAGLYVMACGTLLAALLFLALRSTPERRPPA